MVEMGREWMLETGDAPQPIYTSTCIAQLGRANTLDRDQPIKALAARICMLSIPSAKSIPCVRHRSWHPRYLPGHPSVSS